ncbi:MAG: P1 family peptidase [Pseudomonadota bacterium]
MHLTRNLITDVPGMLVGNASDAHYKTGTTVLTSDRPFTAAVHIMGGAPGTRETDLLAPENSVEQVDALVLSGGSAFGLDAASGVSDALRSSGRGYPVWGQVIPIVPTAIIFDVGRGGATNWETPPWRSLGCEALEAVAEGFAIGTAGAGTGATTASLKGGLGSASQVLPNGTTVGALVVANPIGHVSIGDGPHFWAAPFEQDAEFGGLGPAMAPARLGPTKSETRSATVIGIVATDAPLSKTQAKRVAIMAHDGIARAVVPSHTPSDGDLIFAASTARREEPTSHIDLIHIGHAAATCTARAIARAIYAATPADGDPNPTWQSLFG